MTDPVRVQSLVEFVSGVGGTQIEPTTDGAVDFSLGPVPALAYVKEGGSRTRGSVFLGEAAGPEVARRWIAAQPQPESGVLDCFGTGDGTGTQALRIVFERPAAESPSVGDTLLDDALDYAEAWAEGVDVGALADADRFVVPGDPRDLAPTNAWLLKGTEASFPTDEELATFAARGERGIFEYLWTTAKQTQVGDLALIYFLHPRKAVHFVARTASRAFFDRSIRVVADGAVANEQWWAYITPPIEIEPIPLEILREQAGGHLPLRGRSGLYLRPEMIAALPVRAKRPQDQEALQRVLATPVGRADLLPPEQVTPDAWRNLASGTMSLEAEVSRYVVEPLLRFSLDGTALTWRREYPVGRKWADYVVLDGDRPCCVLEVKLAIREGQNGLWADSPDFAQLRHYATALQCPGVLIDANRILLVAPGADHPYRIIERQHATGDDLELIGSHMSRREGARFPASAPSSDRRARHGDRPDARRAAAT